MPKVTIYIPAMKLKPIELYCKEHNIARGKLLANCTLSFLNSRGQKVFCGYCKRNPAIGKYQLTIYDIDLGEQVKELPLCQTCLKNAQREGDVKEIE